MQFKPLCHAPWINNAIIQVNRNIRLSVSYNISDGLWNCGNINDYEVAIQVGKPETEYWSLVSLENNPNGNIYSHCNLDKIKELEIVASNLIYYAEIEVFDIKDRCITPEWGHRFYCTPGYDFEEKRNYVKNVWGYDCYRINLE